MKWGLRRSLVAAVAILPCLFGFVAAGSKAASAKTAVSSNPISLTKYTKHHAHKKTARRHVRGTKAAKAASTQQTARMDDPDKTGSGTAAPLPPKVADARAELNAGDVSLKPAASTLTDADRYATDADRFSSPAVPNSNGVEIASSDQLNDLDREASNPTVSEVKSAPASIEAPRLAAATPADDPATPVQIATRSETGAWDTASLIGKVFIGFGVLLTLASAARLVIA